MLYSVSLASAGSDPINRPLPDACKQTPKGSEVTASPRQLSNDFSARVGKIQDKSKFAELLVMLRSLDVSAEGTWRPASAIQGFLLRRGPSRKPALLRTSRWLHCHCLDIALSGWDSPV